MEVLWLCLQNKMKLKQKVNRGGKTNECKITKREEEPWENKSLAKEGLRIREK